MSNRKKYNFELLQKYCQENNIKLVKDYTNSKLNSSFLIEYYCTKTNCKNTFIKKFE